MPRRHPPEVRRQVVDLARSGTKVAQLAEAFGVEASIYNWLKQDRIDRREIDGLSTDQALELAAAKRRIEQLETELAVARKVNEAFLREGRRRLLDWRLRCSPSHPAATYLGGPRRTG